MIRQNKKYPQSASGGVTTFTSQEIWQQLQRILNSPDFDATRQQRDLFEFVVSQTLAGHSKSIKGYTVATQVFGRDEDFDPAIDPIVSIQANKLRRSLERYYLLSGKHDSIHIDIPKGTYVPVFKERMPTVPDPLSRRSKDKADSSKDSWPTVLIKPFQNHTNDSAKNFWGIGFASELAMEINKSKWLNILQFGPEGQGKRGTDTGARFVVDGSIREDKSGIKLVVNLLDTHKNIQIWNDTLWFRGNISQIIAFQERSASLIGAKIAGEQGIITRTLSADSKSNPPAQMATYEAILQYHAYDQTLAPEDFSRALKSLENARKNEPDCGQAWSFLARLYANIVSLEIPGFDLAEAEQKALDYAEKGVTLNPDNQGAFAILALVRMFTDDLVAARRDIDKAYSIDPDSYYLMDGIGYLKTLLGDWELGSELICRAIKHNPYYKTVVHYALWEDSLRKMDLERAYLETTELRRPSVFWYPLAKASTLGLLDRIQEGEKHAWDLLKLKPDFRQRGRVLIGRYIKFEEIADLVIDGLARVGVNID